MQFGFHGEFSIIGWMWSMPTSGLIAAAGKHISTFSTTVLHNQSHRHRHNVDPLTTKAQVEIYWFSGSEIKQK